MTNENIVSRFLKCLADWKEFACGDLKYTEDSKAVEIAAKRPTSSVAMSTYFDTITGLTYVCGREYSEEKGKQFILSPKNDQGNYNEFGRSGSPDTDIWVKNSGGRLIMANEYVDEDWAWHHRGSNTHIEWLRERFMKALMVEKMLDQLVKENLQEVLEAGEYRDWKGFIKIIMPYAHGFDWTDCGSISAFLAAESDRINGRPERQYCY